MKELTCAHCGKSTADPEIQFDYVDRVYKYRRIEKHPYGEEGVLLGIGDDVDVMDDDTWNGEIYCHGCHRSFSIPDGFWGYTEYA